MADTSESELKSPPHTNGVLASDGIDEEDRQKMRPADIDADVKEMERRKRVDMIMSSKLFREELERIIETQLKDGTGSASGLMQQISDMMGVPKNAGNAFKSSNCVIPINDIRGIEAMGYAKGEKILRCKLAAVYRLVDLYGWSQGISTLITARLNQDEEHFLVNPYGMLFHEITASSLIKVDMQGTVVEQGTTNFSVNIASFSLHAAIHSSRPDIKCIIHVRTPSVVAISALKCGILPISEQAVVVGEASTHLHLGGILSTEEIEKIARNLGPNNKVLILTNQGIICCGETIEEAFFNARNTVLACEQQLKLMPVGIDNLVLITDEQRKKLYDAAHKAPESTPRPDQPSVLEGKVERKWRVGGVEFEALMRLLDNAGFRTGYIYRHPLVKGEPPKPKNDVEVPPAVSSLGYLMEEEELYRQGLWKKLEGGKKGNDRSRWLNSPNVYQKVEILETGTPDPKKITKWVADGSPTHSSTPVKIENALQFVPKNTNPKEFKLLQQQIKDYRRADKISAGPQSHILEGVTWEEAKKMQDATVTQTGDQVVLMGAASKGIIQRGFQHNATMYKSPYAKNPFDCVTDEELDEYKRVVERKARGDFDDTTDYSESEGLSAQINKRISDVRSPTSMASETEEESRDEPQVLRIETTQAPKPSQPEVVMSDDDPVSDHQQYDAIEKLKSEALLLQSSPVSRASIHSTKSRLAKLQNAKKDSYRTTDYFGHPKGSYLLPNPRHFHIAAHRILNQVCRPKFVKILNSEFQKFNVKTNLEKPMVTINIGGNKTLSLDIPMKTLRDFIAPFASALNMKDMGDFQDVSSQTSYRNIKESHVSIVELNSSETTSSKSEDTSSSSEYEEGILRKMHDGIFSNEVDDNEDFDTNTKVDMEGNNGNVVENDNAEVQSINDDIDASTECEVHEYEEIFDKVNKEFDEALEEVREQRAIADNEVVVQHELIKELSDVNNQLDQKQTYQNIYPDLTELESSSSGLSVDTQQRTTTLRSLLRKDLDRFYESNPFSDILGQPQDFLNADRNFPFRQFRGQPLTMKEIVEGTHKSLALIFLDTVLWHSLIAVAEKSNLLVTVKGSESSKTKSEINESDKKLENELDKTLRNKEVIEHIMKGSPEHSHIFTMDQLKKFFFSTPIQSYLSGGSSSERLKRLSISRRLPSQIKKLQRLRGKSGMGTQSNDVETYLRLQEVFQIRREDAPQFKPEEASESKTVTNLQDSHLEGRHRSRGVVKCRRSQTKNQAKLQSENQVGPRTENEVGSQSEKEVGSQSEKEVEYLPKKILGKLQSIKRSRSEERFRSEIQGGCQLNSQSETNLGTQLEHEVASQSKNVSKIQNKTQSKKKSPSKSESKNQAKSQSTNSVQSQQKNQEKNQEKTQQKNDVIVQSNAQLKPKLNVDGSQPDVYEDSQLNHLSEVKEKCEIKSESNAATESQLEIEGGPQLIIQESEPPVESQLEKVETQAESVFRSQENAQSETRVESQLESQVESQLESQVESQLDNQMENQIEPEIENEIESEFENQVQSESVNQVESESVNQGNSDNQEESKSQAAGSDKKPSLCELIIKSLLNNTLTFKTEEEFDALDPAEKNKYHIYPKKDSNGDKNPKKKNNNEKLAREDKDKLLNSASEEQKGVETNTEESQSDSVASIKIPTYESDQSQKNTASTLRYPEKVSNGNKNPKKKNNNEKVAREDEAKLLKGATQELKCVEINTETQSVSIGSIKIPTYYLDQCQKNTTSTRKNPEKAFNGNEKPNKKNNNKKAKGNDEDKLLNSAQEQKGVEINAEGNASKKTADVASSTGSPPTLDQHVKEMLKEQLPSTTYLYIEIEKIPDNGKTTNDKNGKAEEEKPNELKKDNGTNVGKKVFAEEILLPKPKRKHESKEIEEQKERKKIEKIPDNGKTTNGKNGKAEEENPNELKKDNGTNVGKKVVAEEILLPKPKRKHESKEIEEQKERKKIENIPDNRKTINDKNGKAEEEKPNELKKDNGTNVGKKVFAEEILLPKPKRKHESKEIEEQKERKKIEKIPDNGKTTNDKNGKEEEKKPNELKKDNGTNVGKKVFAEEMLLPKPKRKHESKEIEEQKERKKIEKIPDNGKTTNDKNGKAEEEKPNELKKDNGTNVGKKVFAEEVLLPKPKRKHESKEIEEQKERKKIEKIPDNGKTTNDKNGKAEEEKPNELKKDYGTNVGKKVFAEEVLLPKPKRKHELKEIEEQKERKKIEKIPDNGKTTNGKNGKAEGENPNELKKDNGTNVGKKVFAEEVLLPKPKRKHESKEIEEQKERKKGKKPSVFEDKKKFEKALKDKHKKQSRQSKRLLYMEPKECEAKKEKMNAEDYFAKLYEAFQKIFDIIPVSRISNMDELFDNFKTLNDLLSNIPEGNVKNLSERIVDKSELSALKLDVDEAMKQLPVIQKTVGLCKHKIRLRKGQTCIRGSCRNAPKIEDYVVREDIEVILGKKLVVDESNEKGEKNTKKEIAKILFGESSNNKENKNAYARKNNIVKDNKSDPGVQRNTFESGEVKKCLSSCEIHPQTDDEYKKKLRDGWKTLLKSKITSLELPLYCNKCYPSMPFSESYAVNLLDFDIKESFKCKLCTRPHLKVYIFMVDIMSCIGRDNAVLVRKAKENKIFRTILTPPRKMAKKARKTHDEPDKQQLGDKKEDETNDDKDECATEEDVDEEDLQWAEHTGGYDRRILHIATVLYDCIVKLCRYDQFNNENVRKMLNELKDFYFENCSDISDDVKYDMKMKITTYISWRVEKNFKKIYGERSMPVIFRLVTKVLNNFYASTFHADTEEVRRRLATFKAKRSPSGNELYWMTLPKDNQEENAKKCSPKNIINVDDIPLKPPRDLVDNKKLTDSERSLSPIGEEGDLKTKFTDLMMAGGDFVRFESPDTNVVVSNETQFFRSDSVARSGYVQSSSVTFVANDNGINGDNNVESEGNWMGYPKAKF